MIDDRKITISIPSFNRSDMTIEAFYEVYNDERISEIIICDDASDMDIYEDLKSMTDALPKVKLYRNPTNQDCYRNKCAAMGYATNEWCILLDSDNKIDKSYIDTLYSLEFWDENAIYTPTFARPHFDFRPYESMIFLKSNVSQYVDKPMWETMLNASNFFINKASYFKVWDGSVDPVTSDSIYFSLKWLESGRSIQPIKGLEYEHAVHDGSHYKNNVHRTPSGFHESILNQIRNLK